MKIQLYHHFPQEPTDNRLDLIIDLLRRIENKIDILAEDPTGTKKQEIMNKLNIAIADLKTTV